LELQPHWKDETTATRAGTFYRFVLVLFFVGISFDDLAFASGRMQHRTAALLTCFN
jgi:hypothetical protein